MAADNGSVSEQRADGATEYSTATPGSTLSSGHTLVELND